MIGKTLKSKINGALFVVEGIKNDGGKDYYTIVELATGRKFMALKGWFEKGIMQNLVEVEGDNHD